MKHPSLDISGRGLVLFQAIKLIGGKNYARGNTGTSDFDEEVLPLEERNTNPLIEGVDPINAVELAPLTTGTMLPNSSSSTLSTTVPCLNTKSNSLSCASAFSLAKSQLNSLQGDARSSAPPPKTLSLCDANGSEYLSGADTRESNDPSSAPLMWQRVRGRGCEAA